MDRELAEHKMPRLVAFVDVIRQKTSFIACLMWGERMWCFKRRQQASDCHGRVASHRPGVMDGSGNNHNPSFASNIDWQT